VSVSTLRIPSDTEQVRVARLVAGTAARMAGVDADEIEDVRLAVGEAVGRAVLRHLDQQVQAPVVIEFCEDDESFAVLVYDEANDTGEDNGFAMAVITGLVPVAVLSGRTVSMTWPL
jgi:anti-sigma regulatory factor (Ser/Thr protein kinase)